MSRQSDGYAERVLNIYTTIMPHLPADMTSRDAIGLAVLMVRLTLKQAPEQHRQTMKEQTIQAIEAALRDLP